MALLVTKGEKEFVLKVALNEDDNARLHEEAEALRSIHSEFIVAIDDELKMGGRTVLVLQKAGDETLAARLRKEGVPAWSCSRGSARTCSRRSLRWSGTASSTATSSPTTSASAR